MLVPVDVVVRKVYVAERIPGTRHDAFGHKLCIDVWLWRIFNRLVFGAQILLQVAAVTKLTTLSMTRAKSSSEKKKVGRKSYFSVRKENIVCDNFGEAYLAAHATSKPEVGLFLNKISNWVIDRWGYSTSLHVDIDGEDDDPSEVFNLEVSSPDDDISEEVAAERTAYYDDIRTVSLLVVTYSVCSPLV